MHIPTYSSISVHIPTYSYVFIHILTYSYIFLHIHTYSYIFLHLHTYSYIFIHILTYSYIILHILTHSCIFLHILTYLYIFLHIPTYSYRFKHILTDSYIFSHAGGFACCWTVARCICTCARSVACLSPGLQDSARLLVRKAVQGHESPPMQSLPWLMQEGAATICLSFCQSARLPALPDLAFLCLILHLRLRSLACL